MTGTTSFTPDPHVVSQSEAQAGVSYRSAVVFAPRTPGPAPEEGVA